MISKWRVSPIVLGAAALMLALHCASATQPRAAGGSTLRAGLLDPPTADPKHYTVEFENEHVRVIRARYGAHEKGEVHKHPCGRVVVSLTDLHEVITDSEGRRSESRGKAGEVGWGGIEQHQGENMADQPFEVVIIDVKGACPADVLAR